MIYFKKKLIYIYEIILVFVFPLVSIFFQSRLYKLMRGRACFEVHDIGTLQIAKHVPKSFPQLILHGIKDNGLPHAHGVLGH